MKSALLVGLSGLLAVGAGADDAAKAKKGKVPGLELRATPRFAFSPVNVLLIAELKGGDDLEDFYCPEIEWDWDDGGKSVNEADCPPYEAGARIERRFSAEHEYRQSGVYSVQVTLRRNGRPISKQTVRVTVRPGLGDPTNAPSN